MTDKTLPHGAAGAPPARFDGDKALALVCVGVPLIGLVLFFLYPMAIVFLRSITTIDGEYGLSNYAEVLGSSGFWRATRYSVSFWDSSLHTGFIAAPFGASG